MTQTVICFKQISNFKFQTFRFWLSSVTRPRNYTVAEVLNTRIIIYSTKYTAQKRVGRKSARRFLVWFACGTLCLVDWPNTILHFVKFMSLHDIRPTYTIFRYYNLRTNHQLVYVHKDSMTLFINDYELSTLIELCW